MYVDDVLCTNLNKIYVPSHHLNKGTVVKFERDVKTPQKENDVTIIIFMFK